MVVPMLHICRVAINLPWEKVQLEKVCTKKVYKMEKKFVTGWIQTHILKINKNKNFNEVAG